MPQDLPVLLHNDKRGLLTLEEGNLDVLQLSRDGRPPRRLLSCSARNILRARLASTQVGKNTRLDLHTLLAKGSNLRLSVMHVLVEPNNVVEAEEWVGMVMDAAYAGLKPFRRVLLLVNPVGGKGKAKATVRDVVVPILEAAGCVIELKETKHRNHAEEIIRDMSLDYDVISPVSGDGLIYEVINGLAARPDAKKALRIPIGPIPTGSANSLCINLFGPQDTFNIQLACLNIIKGQEMPKDLYSVLFVESQKRIWSFLSQAIGLMVDADLGTESIRWMGDVRFTLGFIKGVAASRNHKCRIRMRVLDEDKVEMARRARTWATKSREHKPVGGGVNPLVNGMKKLELGNGHTADVAGGTKKGGDENSKGSEAANGPIDDGGDKAGPLPAMKPLQPDNSWMTIETGSKPAISKSQRDVIAAETGKSGSWVDGEGVLYAYAGGVPWVARDLMQWPVAVQGSGSFDMVVQSITPRAEVLAAVSGAAKGEQYWMDCQHYYKINAYIVENLDRANQKQVSIDGEGFPYEDFHVEIHPGLCRILTLDGHLFISEFLQRHDTK